jgi:hypothetical protein
MHHLHPSPSTRTAIFFVSGSQSLSLRPPRGAKHCLNDAHMVIMPTSSCRFCLHCILLRQAVILWLTAL